MGALHCINLAKPEIGYPEFPSLNVSRSRLTSIKICVKFGGQKLSNSHTPVLFGSAAAAPGAAPGPRANLTPPESPAEASPSVPVYTVLWQRVPASPAGHLHHQRSRLEGSKIQTQVQL